MIWWYVMSATQASDESPMNMTLNLACEFFSLILLYEFNATTTTNEWHVLMGGSMIYYEIHSSDMI